MAAALSIVLLIAFGIMLFAYVCISDTDTSRTSYDEA